MRVNLKEIASFLLVAVMIITVIWIFVAINLITFKELAQDGLIIKNSILLALATLFDAVLIKAILIFIRTRQKE